MHHPCHFFEHFKIVFLLCILKQHSCKKLCGSVQIGKCEKGCEIERAAKKWL